MTLTVMRFSVRVPVLSEQITVTEPKVSTAGSLRIKAPLFSIRCEPKARAMVTTAGKLSGTAATAILTPVRNMSLIPCPCHSPKTKIIITKPTAAINKSRPSFCRCRCKGVSCELTLCNRVAILPNSVFMPVAVTTACPRP